MRYSSTCRESLPMPTSSAGSILTCGGQVTTEPAEDKTNKVTKKMHQRTLDGGSSNR